AARRPPEHDAWHVPGADQAPEHLHHPRLADQLVEGLGAEAGGEGGGGLGAEAAGKELALVSHVAKSTPALRWPPAPLTLALSPKGEREGIQRSRMPPWATAGTATQTCPREPSTARGVATARATARPARSTASSTR